jgi:hypothetical protein
VVGDGGWSNTGVGEPGLEELGRSGAHRREWRAVGRSSLTAAGRREVGGAGEVVGKHRGVMEELKDVVVAPNGDWRRLASGRSHEAPSGDAAGGSA